MTVTVNQSFNEFAEDCKQNAYSPINECGYCLRMVGPCTQETCPRGCQQPDVVTAGAFAMGVPNRNARMYKSPGVYCSEHDYGLSNVTLSHDSGESNYRGFVESNTCDSSEISCFASHVKTPEVDLAADMFDRKSANLVNDILRDNAPSSMERIVRSVYDQMKASVKDYVTNINMDIDEEEIADLLGLTDLVKAPKVHDGNVLDTTYGQVLSMNPEEVAVLCTEHTPRIVAKIQCNEANNFVVAHHENARGGSYKTMGVEEVLVKLYGRRNLWPDWLKEIEIYG